MLDIFFEALNYETIEQKKAYEVAGLLGEHCAEGSGWHPSVQPLVLSLQSWGTMVCTQRGCRAEQSNPQGHSSDEFCPFSAPSATSALLTAFLSPPR